MIFREFPVTLLITPYDEEGYEEGEQIKITVMFVTKKFRALPDGSQSEDMVAVGYDSDKNIHEAILNQSKIIEVEPYGNRTKRQDSRRKNTGGASPSGDKDS